MRNLKNIYKIILMTACITIYLCGCQKESSSEQYKVGVLATSETEDDSTIYYYDKDYQPVSDAAYKAANLSIGGEHACIVNDNLYMLHLGKNDSRDAGIVIRKNLNTGEETEYKFDRINITCITADEKYVYAISNYNWDVYLDRIDQETMEKDSMKMDVDILYIKAHEGKVYGFSTDMETDIPSICSIDFDTKQVDNIYTSRNTTMSSDMAFYQDTLYLCDDDQLILCSLTDGKTETKTLERKQAHSIQVREDAIYIGFTDTFSDDDSYIQILDPAAFSVRAEIKIEGPIYQMEVDEKAYVYNLDQIKVYDLSSDQGECIASFSEIPEKYYCSGFYLR